MFGQRSGVSIPSEILAQQRQLRQRTLRLYGITTIAAVAIVAAGFYAYSTFVMAGIDADNRFATAVTSASTDYSQGNYAAAEREMRAAVASQDGYNVRFDLGIILLSAGKYAQALPQLRKAEEYYPKAPSAYIYAAIAGLAMHRPDLARIQAARVLKLVPHDPLGNALLAQADSALGRKAEAVRHLGTARSNGYTGGTLSTWIHKEDFEYDQPAAGG